MTSVGQITVEDLHGSEGQEGGGGGGVGVWDGGWRLSKKEKDHYFYGIVKERSLFIC